MEKSIPGRATSAKDGPEKHFLSLARQKRAARARSGVWGRERSVKVKANEKRAMSREDMALFICCLCNSRIFTIGGGNIPCPSYLPCPNLSPLPCPDLSPPPRPDPPDLPELPCCAPLGRPLTDPPPNACPLVFGLENDGLLMPPP